MNKKERASLADRLILFLLRRHPRHWLGIIIGVICFVVGVLILPSAGQFPALLLGILFLCLGLLGTVG